MFWVKKFAVWLSFSSVLHFFLFIHFVRCALILSAFHLPFIYLLFIFYYIKCKSHLSAMVISAPFFMFSRSLNMHPTPPCLSF